MKKIINLLFNRTIVSSMINRFIGVKVNGLENLKDLEGNVLFIANHNSFLDAVLIWAFIPEKLCFTISPLVAKKWWVKPFLHLAKFFPVDSTKPMAVKSIIEEVRKGSRVVIYPEGRITTTGKIMKIYPGPAIIADRSNAKIVPIYIEGSQYSFFSHFGSKFKVRPKSKITVNVFPPAKFKIPDSLRGEPRKKAITRELYDIMTNAKYFSAPLKQTIFDSLIDASKLIGRKKAVIEDINRKPAGYGLLLTMSFILGKQFLKSGKPGEYVGFMLPNSIAAIATFFGFQAFGIVPCMLNFSTGIKNMLSCCKAAKIKNVYTSREFIAKIEFSEVIEAMEKEGIKIIYLEDIKKQIKLKDKLIGLAASFFPRTYYKKNNPLRNPEKPSVILFTSGSEGVPKGVALSHENIQANTSQVSSVLPYSLFDSFFMVLPIFHSFGLTAGMMLPLLSGVKVFYYPSPLHYRVIPELIYDTNSTLIFGTDTFFNGYAKAAHAYDFYSIKIAVVGAEKLKEDTVKKFFDNFGVRVMGGYGATETSPVISVNTHMYYKRDTVGRVLPGIEVRLEDVPGIEDGKRLFVKGKNIMLGYIRVENPGVIVPPENGWYDTGDIVSIDEEGFIRIKGRAKRFAKIAGEMISLTAVEASILKIWPDYMHAVVAVPDEKKGEQLVLFTTREGTVFNEITSSFKSQGLSELFVPKKIKVLKEMILMGNGKVDYVALNQSAGELFCSNSVAAASIQD